ncbi:hypothetical protein [Halobacterium wangiae]|uniref:hypothetical protein n=1 Tax=Halobacterium wangiae TaxID=2902623 RepID=UPI001E369C7D|nr:hypothetical protein [Halobacterium wangiae]
MPQSRRAILRRGLLLGSVGLAGCVTEQDDGTPTTTDDEMPTEIRFWLEEVTRSEAERDATEPIVFSDLPNEQREIVRTALEEGEYTSEIGAESAALENLRRSVSARTDGELEAYLERGDTCYRIGFVSGDHIIADPDY